MITVEYNGITFTQNEIENLPNLYRVIDPISYDLEYDVFNLSVKSDSIGEQKLKDKFSRWLATSADEGIVVDSGDFADFIYGDTLNVYENGVLKAVMYVIDIYPANSRDKTKELFRIQCVSGIGILSRIEHYGGVYVGTTAGEIIADIMGDLPYTIDSAFAAEMLYGWLPYVKDARQNLNKVLFATGASILRNSQGTVHFAYNRPDEAKIIPTSRTFWGGLDVRREHKSAITVIEHGYFQSLEAVEELIFDNTNGVAGDSTRITFDQPYYDYRGDGLTVDESSANWAVITGQGYLYAKRYVHTQRPMTEIIDTVGQPETLQISDQTLVSSLNINSVMDRLTNYYSNAKIRKFDIEVTDEAPGDLIQFTDRREQEHIGYIKSIDENASSFWRGTVEAVTDWRPTATGNDFTHYQIVTEEDLENGVWNVPAEMQGHRARVVVFSGAEGGDGGEAGETMGAVSGGRPNDVLVYKSYSETNPKSRYVGALQTPIQRGGAGGKGGKGGASATRILNVDVESLAVSYPVTFGAGGEGGAGGTVVRDNDMVATITPPEAGSPGENSVFNGTSTALGAVFRGTYINLITGEPLAFAGDSGVTGGTGGDGGPSEQVRSGFETQQEAQAFDYSVLGKGQNGEAVGTNAGGLGHAGNRGNVYHAYGSGDRLPAGYHLICNGGGGGGGGAAMGADGSDGEVAHYDSQTVHYNAGTDREHTDTYYFVNTVVKMLGSGELHIYAATGGDGADVAVVPATVMFRGGFGGHGGGGGGGSGQCAGSYTSYRDENNEYHGSSYGGKGGNGGKGGDGSDGFMIVYW